MKHQQDHCNTVFARKSDLQRHIQTKHSQGHSHFCPFEDCDRSIEGYPRKDKLDEHNKKLHPMFQCTLDHCGCKVIESGKQSLFDEWHRGKCKTDHAQEGIYECNFSGCHSSNSQLNDLSAKRHLVNHHKSSEWGTFSAILQPAPTAKNRPCTYCVKAKPNTRTNEESPSNVAHSADVTDRHSAHWII